MADSAPSSLEHESAPRIALAETCRVVGDFVPLWPWHRERLVEGGCSERVPHVAYPGVGGMIDM